MRRIVLLHLYTFLLFLELIIAIPFIWDSLIIYWKNLSPSWTSLLDSYFLLHKGFLPLDFW